MFLDAICIIQGPGDLAFTIEDGVLYVYTKDKIDEAPKNARIYRIEEGYNRFYMGEPETVRSVVYGQNKPQEVDMEL